MHGSAAVFSRSTKIKRHRLVLHDYFAVKKRFGLTERVNLDFRTEFFNILNHTNFDQPVSVVSSPVFGEVMATRNPGRQVQMLLRLSF